MAAKTGRATAGKQVLAAVRAFSDDLLVDEERAFLDIDRGFRAALPAASKALDRSLARAGGNVSRLRSNTTLRNALLAGQREASERAAAVIGALYATAAGRAYDAIEKELVICEGTLGPRFKGTAAAAVSLVRDGDDTALTQWVQDTVGQDATQARDEFQRDVAAQISAESGGTADPARLVARILSEKPLGYRGHTGVGVWWRPASTLRATARGVSIGVANEVRMASMEAFNQVADARG